MDLNPTPANRVQTISSVILVTVFIFIVIIFFYITQIRSKVVPSLQTKVDYLDVVTTSGGTVVFENTWVQPLNSKIISIQAIPLAGITSGATGTGIQVGTSTGGVDVVAYVSTALATGTSACTPLKIYTASITDSGSYTNVKRTVYFGVKFVSSVGTGGNVRYIIQYQVYQ